LGQIAMSRPPSGTVTFLFTDIEGSTQWWERHPEWMAQAFARQEAILRSAAAAHAGYVYKMIGDAFQVAFDTAPEALEAAIDAQRALYAEPWGDTGPLRVRMALHTGVTEEREDDYVGPVLNRLARLMSAGRGGQILLSQAAYELVRDVSLADLRFEDLGLHRLKDLIRPEQIYQATASGLPSEFPKLRTLDAFPHNLPLQLTSFVGREKEILEVKHLLERDRFVTLLGPGGTGKTRLALQVGAEMLELFADGVWLVELAALSDPLLVPRAVAEVLGVRESSDHPMPPVLIHYLRGKKLLLILDNCEHLVSACAQLAAALLQACPQLCILATSREALETSGERPLHVPSLSTPDARRLPAALETLTQYEAVQLFIERVEAVQPGFSVTNRNAPAVAQICHRLDGIPLAIELAAARVKMMPVEQVAARLDDAFRLLTGGSRTALPRHQTLRALIDWSYDLLSDPERILLQRLSVFADGWTLEAAEAICAGNAIEQDDIVDVLAQLINKSLVSIDTAPRTESRYRLLGTLRQYAGEKLGRAAGHASLMDLYLDYFQAFVEQAEPELRSPNQVHWLNRLEAELDNLRAALEWALTHSVERGLQIGATLLWFWHIRGNKSEGIDWLERLLTAESGQRSQPLTAARALARGKALNAIGCLMALQGSVEKRNGIVFAEESLALHRNLDRAGQHGMAYALWNLAQMAAQHEDLARARTLMESSLAIFRETGDRFGIAQCLEGLGDYALREEEVEQARAAWEEGLAIRKELGDQDGIGYSLNQLGRLAYEEGEYERAGDLYEESLTVFRGVGNNWAMSIALSGLGSVALAQGEYEPAAQTYKTILSLNRDLGDQHAVAGALHNLAGVAWRRGDYEEARTLLNEALTVLREVGNKAVIAEILCELGRVAWMQGAYDLASKRYEEALAIGHEIKGAFTIAAALYGLGIVAKSRDDLDGACSYHKEALARRREANDQRGIIESLQALGSLALAQQELHRAVQLFGAANTFSRQFRVLLPPYEQERYRSELNTVRALLGEKAFSSAWDNGWSMSMAQAVEYALQE
jgi:predicted ATPase/class 3 adenylate cyclase